MSLPPNSSEPNAPLDPAANADPDIHICPACQAPISVATVEPLSEIACPECGFSMIVRGRIDHFELISVAGRGGMGVVYKALDAGLDREVALKLLRIDRKTNAELISQLETEAAITASINDPNVVKVYSTGSDRGRFYIAMELVEKGSLDDLIRIQGRVGEGQVLAVGIQIAKGLMAAHRFGMIHRDVKPGNILFADAQTAKIVDFGLAIFMAQEEAARGEIWGTPYYVAPEKLENRPEDFRSDIYSLGGTLFHAICGRPPFEAENASLVALKHLKSHAVSIQTFAPWVSGSTAFVINRMLHKEPDERYQSYEELIEHLEYAQNELTNKLTKQATTPTRVVVDDASSKVMGLITVGILALIVIGGVAAYFMHGKSTAHPKATPPGAYRSSEVEPDRGSTAANNVPSPPKSLPPKAPLQAVPQKPAAPPKVAWKPPVTPKVAPNVPAPAPVEADAGVDPRLQDSYARLIAGEYSAAIAGFQKLQQESLKQPDLNWATFGEGLAYIAAGARAESKAAFSKITQRGTYSRAGEQGQLSTFFLTVAANMTPDGPTEATVTISDRKSYECLACFAYGLKNWDQGKFPEALSSFRQLRAASPAGNYLWLADLRSLSAIFTHQYTSFELLSSRLTTASSPAERAEIAEQLTTLPGILGVRGQELAAPYAAEIAAAAPGLAAAPKPGTYKLLNRKSRLYATIAGGGLDERARVIQFPLNELPSQEWRLEEAEPGVVMLVAVHSGKALSADRTNAAGAPTKQLPPDRDPSQRWRLTSTGRGWYKLNSESAGKLLTATVGSTESTWLLVQNPDVNSFNQQWRFVPIATKLAGAIGSTATAATATAAGAPTAPPAADEPETALSPGTLEVATGDFILTAHVANMPKGTGPMSVGLTMREAKASGSRMVFVGNREGTPPFDMRRIAVDTPARGTNCEPSVTATWYRIMRRGGVVTTLYSKDGQQWETLVRSIFVKLNRQLLIGPTMNLPTGTPVPPNTFDHVTITKL